MKKLYVLWLGVFFNLFMFCQPLVGQNVNDSVLTSKKDSLLGEITDVDKKVQQFVKVDTIGGKAFRHMLDSLLLGLGNSDIYQLNRDKKGLLKMPTNNWTPFDTSVGFRDTVIFDPAFLPVAFEGRILPDDLTFLSSNTSFVDPDFKSTYHLISPDSTFQPHLEKVEKVKDMRRFYYINHPQDIWVNGLTFTGSTEIKDNAIKKSSIFGSLLSADEAVRLNTPMLETVSIMRSNWKSEGDHSLQISHNSRSKNWGDGGNSSYSVLSHQRIRVNYKKKKVSFTNTVEWKLDLKKEEGDKEHSVSLTEDYLKLYSVLGHEAFSKWSYSSNLTAQTPLFSGYKVNSTNKWRAFLSPLDVNIGVGMSYGLEKSSDLDKYKKLKLSLDLSPLSLNYRNIIDRSVINGDTGYGIEDGKSHKLEFGSNINMNATIVFNRYCSLTSRVRYFTNYERVLFEFENRLNYELNRYLSVSYDLYIRYNDDVNRDKHDKTFGYFQYNQMLRFGLKYKW